MAKEPTIILITGTSHEGKSTLSAAMGKARGWEVISTDSIARHPGRPWPDPAPHIVDFYAALSATTIHTLLLHHHQNMWPSLRHLIEIRRSGGASLILEGAALRPEYLATLKPESLRLICLHACPEVLRQRIRTSSNYSEQPREVQTCIEAFTDRSLTENDALYSAALEAGIDCIATDAPKVLEQIT